MKFVEEHFNQHHLLHKPHRWFLALLISPVHYAEMHYKKKYHLNFAHAKKLFVFDMTLLVSIVFLFGATFFWFNYNPEVVDLVYVSIQPSSTRVASGDYVEYRINYKNDSQVKLIDPILRVNFPIGFILNSVEPADNFQDNYFKLNDLLPSESGGVLIAGWIYGTPDEENHITADLSYRQETRQRSEQKTSLFIKTLRGSVLETTVNSTGVALPQGNLPIVIAIKNTGTQTLTNISMPLPTHANFSFDLTTTTLGTVNNNLWQLTDLAPDQTAELAAKLLTNLKDYQPNLALEFVSNIFINNFSLPQTTAKHDIQIAYPQAEMTAFWQNNPDSVSPGGSATLQINLKNIGNINLLHNIIDIPLPADIVDMQKIINLNGGTLKNNILTITAKEWPGLAELKPNDAQTFNLNIPIQNWPKGGNDITLQISPQLKSQLHGITENYFEKNSESPILKIGTQVLFKAELRYYTDEGDQLGRGPIPPQVDKETKYWVFVSLKNNTSKITEPKFSASLSDRAVWTGKTSVTKGADITYNPATRTVFWSTKSLSAHDSAGIYFELAITPSQNMVGTAPILLTNLSFSASDDYIKTIINKTEPNLDTTLPSDKIAQCKGVIVR